MGSYSAGYFGFDLVAMMSRRALSKTRRSRSAF
jgi:hypothetical protein